jgi:hypothetical protein
MKKHIYFFISALFFTVTLISCSKNYTKRQLAFINTSDRELNIVIERNDKYIVDKQVPAHGMAFDYIDIGKAKILSFDGEKCVQVLKDYDIKADSGSGYLCIDMEGEVKYAIVSTSYLYGASNSLAQSISDAGGGHKMSFLGPIFKSDVPFEIEFAPKWPYEKLPKEIGTLSASWALVPIKIETDDKEALYKYIDNYLKGLLPE